MIVEDEPFIAFDLADAVEHAGGTVVGPAMTVRLALTYITQGDVDGAILDVNLPDGDVGPVIGALKERDLGMIIHTGAGLTPALLKQFPDLRVFTKPTPPSLLARTIAAIVSATRTSGGSMA